MEVVARVDVLVGVWVGNVGVMGVAIVSKEQLSDIAKIQEFLV